MPKPSETVELSYPGLLDGKEYKIPAGTNNLKITDPSWVPTAEFDAVDIPKLTFVRRPHTNKFVLENK